MKENIRNSDSFIYYQVSLDYIKKIPTGGNQWSGPSAVNEHVTNKGTYRFISMENAEKHLDGFLKSRPDSEEWLKCECEYPIVKQYRYIVDDNCYSFEEYRAYITEVEGIPSVFNDGTVTVEINLKKQ